MKFSYMLGAAVALLAAVVPVQAQPYPNKPIRLIVPFPAGGAADLAARIVTQALSEVAWTAAGHRQSRRRRRRHRR